MGERKPAEHIRGQGIDAGLVEYDIRLEGKSSRQDLVKTAQILVVFHAIRQGHIQTALFLAKGEVACTVDGEGEYRGIVLEDFGGSVTLMDIEINDRGAADEAILFQEMNCYRDIVEDAEARSL